jgi:hypothetical protein
MSEILKSIRFKLNGAAFTLISTAIALVLLAAAVVWIPFMVNIIVGLLILVMAFIFGYLGLKFLSIKQDIEKIFKL